MIKISASILSANFANLEQEIRKIEQAGTDMIHIDVMDGHFVPNLTFGNIILKTVRKLTKLPLDVHLMINNPELYIDEYASSGADIITIHPESTIHVDRALELIKKNNIKAGIALIPSTIPNIIDYIIDKIDLILVMSVNPGFPGQIFLNSQLPKIQVIANKIKSGNNNIILSVDGGLNSNTAAQCINAGANMLVAGSYIFAEGNYESRIAKLRNASSCLN